MLAVGSGSGRVALLDPTSGKVRVETAGHLGPTLCVDMSPDGSLIASAADDLTVCIWDAATGAAHFRLRRHDGRDDCKPEVFSGRLIIRMRHSDGRLATGSLDASCLVWDPTTGDSRGVLKHKQMRSVWAVAWSRDGSTLAVGDDDGVWVWISPAAAVAPGRVMRRFTSRGPFPRVSMLSWAPDGAKLFAGHCHSSASDGGSTGRARIYCLASGEIRESLGRDVDPVFSAAFSPCGTVRALGSKTAVLLSAESPGVVPSCAGEQSKLQEIAVSSDLDMDWRAELRLTGHDQLGECRCSARNRHPACPVEGHRGKISAVAFSPHGALSCRVVASGSHDATVLLQLRALLDQSWPRGLCGLIGPIDVELRSSFGVWRRAACFAPLPSRRRSSPTTRGDRDAVSGPRLILMASDPRCQVFSLAFGRDWVRDQQRLAAACALHRRLGQASRLATLDQAFLLPFLMSSSASSSISSNPGHPYLPYDTSISLS